MYSWFPKTIRIYDYFIVIGSKLEIKHNVIVMDRIIIERCSSIYKSIMKRKKLKLLWNKDI